MTRLSARLALNLVAVALIGLLVVDVLYLFAAQRSETRERRLAAALALHEVAAAAREVTPLERQRLVEIAQRYGLVLSLTHRDGSCTQSAEARELVSLSPSPSPFVAHGYEHVGVTLDRDGPFAHALASRRLDEATTRVMADQPRVVAILGGVALLMVVLGLLFMRRTVLQPLERITTWAHSHDEHAILRFGESSDGLAELGRAIIAMNQRGEDDRRRIEAQLRELQAAHDAHSATRDQLVRSERLAAVGRLAAGLAHEIGNPLAVLTGFVGVLDDPKLSVEERRDAHRRMEKELARIQGTVRSLLDFSRAPTSVVGRASVSEVFRQLGALLDPQAKKRRVTLTLTPADLTVAIDANALTQVLLNLALNALDAVPEGGHIELSATARGDDVELAVQDDGPGVGADIAERIFEPFFTTKAAGQGTGLGLSVCESIAHAAGGKLTLDRSVAKGARFVLSLASHEPAHEQARTPAPG